MDDVKVCVVYDENSRDRVLGNYGGCVTVVNWERVRIALEGEIRLGENERLVGLRVNKDGIQCYLESNSHESSPDPADSKARWIQAESSGTGS